MRVVLSVFWEGTNGILARHTSQIGVFAELCDAIDCTETPIEQLSLPENAQLKMAFDGCGVTYGCAGTLFASGLREETEKVRTVVKALIEAGHTVECNCIGLSRGGIASIFVAQELSNVSGEHLSLNLLLFDPVPGNLVSTRLPIICCCSTATQSLDLSYCTKNLKHVLAIYPYEPLPDIAFHAPVLPSPPPPDCCLYEEDVSLGCHQGALRWPPSALDSRLSFNRIWDFLHKHGTALNGGFHEE